MRIYNKLMITFLALIVIPVLVVSYMSFYNAKQTIEREIGSKLNILTDEEADGIESFFSERRSDLATMAGIGVVRKDISTLGRFSGDRTSPAYAAAKEAIDGRLTVFQKVYGYHNIILANMDGRILYVSDPSYKNDIDTVIPYIADVLQSVKIGTYAGDMRKDHSHENIYTLFMAAPVYDEADKAVGLIGVKANMANVFKLLNKGNSTGSSWEALLVTKMPTGDVMPISPLKYDPGAILKKSIKIGDRFAFPAQSAAQGHSGSGIYNDYRGEKVIATWQPIPSMGWGLVTKVDLKEVFAPIRKLGSLLIAIILVTVFSAVIAALAVARSISEPIHKLHKGTEIIAEGDLAYRVGTTTQDEIGQLSRAFDTMTSELKKKIVSIDDLNKEIAERIKMQQQLAQSQTMAALGRFSAGAAHEIKNPLGIILGGMEYLHAKYRDADEESKETIGMVSDAVLRTDAIINALTGLAGPAEHKVRKVDARTVVEDTVLLLKSKLKDRQINFSATAEEGLVIEVDIDQVQHALLGILTNASDAIPDGGDVKVTVRKEVPATCVIEIADTGEGISEDTMPKIFEPFFTTRRDRKQIGLGLTVAKEFIGLNKGDISITSKKGEGTAVKISFPIAA